MRRKLEHKWEKLDANTYRCMVIGGWLVKAESGKGVALQFIHDVNHDWINLAKVVDIPAPKAMAKK